MTVDLTPVPVTGLYESDWAALIAAVDPAKRGNYEVNAALVAIEQAMAKASRDRGAIPSAAKAAVCPFRALTPEHRRMLKSVRPDASGVRSLALPATQKLGGGKPYRPKLALADYLEAEAQPPTSLHRGEFAGYTDVLANDTLGDCGEAMTCHAFEGIHHAAGTPVPPFVRGDAITLYSEVAGYVPGDPSTDQGTDNAVLFPYLQSHGVKCAADGTVHKIAASLFVDPLDEVQNKVAIYEFAVLFRAMNMPLSAQGQTTWSVVGDGKTGNSAPGSWGGHDIPFMAYDENDYDADSWGQHIPVTESFDRAYALQGIVVITPEMLNRTGVSPSGLNYTKLMADYRKLVAGGDHS